MSNDITESSGCSDELSDATVDEVVVEDEAVVEEDNNADQLFEYAHPASDHDFAVVAVLAALATEMDATGSELPPLWPRVLHCFSNFDSSSLRMIHSPCVDASIPLLMRTLCSPLSRHQQAGARGIHLLLKRSGSFIDHVVAAGAMPPLAELLDDDSVPLTQMDAVSVLAEISCFPKHTAALVKVPGAVAGFVRLLLSANEDVCVQAARMLSNCAALLPGALRNDALSNLVQVLKRSKKSTETLNLRRNVVWTISECCRAQPPPPLSVAADAIPVLVETVRNADDDVLFDSMWALAYLSQCGAEYISVVIESGALSAIMPHLQSRSSNVAYRALRCLSNLLRGDNRQVALAVEHGAITALCVLRKSRQGPSWSWEWMKGILHAFGNIAGGDSQQVNALLQAGVFDFIADEVGNRGAHEDDFSGDEAAADNAAVIRYESQRIVANGLRNASQADRTAIIGSASFQALLNAASSQSVGFAGIECIDLVLKQMFGNITDSTAILPVSELSVLVQVLARSTGEEPRNLRRCGAWAIKNCCRGRPLPPLDLVAATVPVLVEITKDSDAKTVGDALWALAYISQCSSEYISVLLDNGALPTIMQHLQSSSWNVAYPALRCLSNILHGDAHQTAFAIEHGAITTLCAVLRTASLSPEWHRERKHDILRILGNIAGEGAQQVNKLLQAGVFDFTACHVGNNDRGNPWAIAGDAADIRLESQRVVANALWNASQADRTAIIGSASFRALLNAASSQSVGFAGMEGIDFVLNRKADIDADELVAIVAALRDIKCPSGMQVERIDSWLRRFEAKSLQDATPIQQPRRKQPPPPQR
jgi:hypothetical protein